MTDNVCEQVRVQLALGETDGLGHHLDECKECRAEAQRMERLTMHLASSAAIQPPAQLDALVRSMLIEEPFGILSRPWLAGGLAVASFLALVAALAGVLANTPAAEYGALLAVVLGSAYMAISAAVALPLLIHLVRQRPQATEVRA